MLDEETALPAQEKSKVPPSYQFRALSRKNITLQSRQWGTNICQIAVPLLLVSVAGLIQILFNIYVISSYTPDQQIMTEPSLVTFNNLTTNGQCVGNCTKNWENYNLWHTEVEWTVDIGNLTESGIGNQGMLGEITQYVNTSNTDPLSPITYTPWYYYYPGGEDAMLNYLNEQKEYWVQRQLANQIYPRCYTCPEAANIFNSLNIAPNTSSPSSIDYQILIDTQLGEYQLKLEHTMINLIDTAFLRYATKNSSWTIITWVQALPYIEQTPSFDIGSFLGLLLYPFAVSFVLAIYVNSIVVEKQERLREMMRMNGLSMIWYWFVNYLWDIFLYFFIILMMIVVSVAYGLRMFTQTSYIIWITILIGWGNCQVGMGFVLSTFFNKARTATIVSYLLVIAGVVFSYVLNATIFKENSDNPAIYTLFFLYPPFACYRAIYLIGAGCTVLECPQISEIQVGGELFWIMIFLYIDIIIYFPLAIYLDLIIPREFGVAKHPLFPIKALIKFIKQKRNVVTEDEEASLVKIHGTTEEEEEITDPDVGNEEERIGSNKIPSDSPIILYKLRKIYKPKPGTPLKIAVKSLSFHVEKGECFGLLGPNGAGKTTTISILTGLYPATSGQATIGGFPIDQDMDKIHRIMSVCPQFDTLWFEMTCRETLLFYARLKGVSSKKEKKHVNKILEQVGLSQYGNRKAKDLSGGMRRRLSIGIALIGHTKVIFLDEPTTGLDPETRRHLWDVLMKLLKPKKNGEKKDRCIILTTHSMEEADILCSRIGIMSRGKLKCIGNQLHLKRNFGEGYTIHVNFQPECEKKVLRFIEDILPGATLMENFACNVVFQIKLNQLVVSDVFEIMEKNKKQMGIVDWGISQTTMEDVFIRIARRDEMEEEMGN